MEVNENKIYICPICESKYFEISSFGRHCSKKHNLKEKELYLKMYNLIEPTCACGCGKIVTFLSIGRGFRTYVKGHLSKVPGRNSWGNNPKALENSINTRREMFESGELVVWNVGLSKETDERVAAYGRAVSESIRGNLEEMERRREFFRQGRKDGTIPTQYGPNHSQWNGGVSTIVRYCYANKRLQAEWKLPKLIVAGCKCTECGNNGQLHIHHDCEKMNDIIRKVMKENDIELESIYQNPEGVPIELKHRISDLVAEYHIKNNISGVVICKKCHKEEHSHMNS